MKRTRLNLPPKLQKTARFFVTWVVRLNLPPKLQKTARFFVTWVASLDTTQTVHEPEFLLRGHEDITAKKQYCIPRTTY